MANRTIFIPRAHLIMALCLPLAILLGYMLAEPMESGSLAVVTFVLVVLSVPLVMKWHHPMLVLSWNAYSFLAFLPGSPALWIPMALVSLFFALLNRSVNPEQRFLHVPALTSSLMFLLTVVGGTAAATGGIGFNAFGSSRFGGTHYLYVFAAIGGFFALCSQRIPPERAPLYLVLFFLPGVTALIGNLAYVLGPGAHFLLYLFPTDMFNQMNADHAFSEHITRVFGLPIAAVGLYSLVLARYGIRGTFDLRSFWRGLLLALAILACLASGYRANLILLLLTLCCLFFVEGLHRTRLLAVFAALGFLAAIAVFGFSEKLPWPVQRTLSFLPIKVDTVVAQSALATSEWRLNMWKAVLPEVPQHLLKGKGYGMDPNELYQSTYLSGAFDENFRSSIISGDYHNGPLSVVIPFGLLGVLAFALFIGATIRFLYRCQRFGEPALQTANRFLLAAVLAKLVLFLGVFGSFYTDLAFFTGIAGFAVSLNGREPKPEVANEPCEETLESDF